MNLLASRPRVLLVDDHDEILVAIQRILAPTCDIVGAITYGVLAIKTASTLQPDVIMLDVNMPDINGLDLCRELVDTLPGIRVVILTTLTEEEVEQEAYRRGASAFVRKRDMAERLPLVIRHLVKHAPPVTPARD